MELGQLIGKGRTAEVYRCDNERVVKLFREGFPESLINYEFKANSIAQQSISNVPVVYEKFTHGERTGLLYEFVPGPNLSEMIFSKPSKALSLTTEFAQLHAKIHEIKAPELRTQKEYIRNNIESADVLDSNRKTAILEYLDRLPSGQSLCHFDYHFENIICSSRGLFVIDWMNAVRGSACADAARTRHILRYSVPTGKPSLMKRRIIRIFRKAVTKRYVKEYCRSAGCSQEEIDKWDLPILAGRLSENVPEEHITILQQIDRLLE
jgi:tRNA A-37 threonylcarbamoyl transferase component Bud32